MTADRVQLRVLAALSAVAPVASLDVDAVNHAITVSTAESATPQQLAALRAAIDTFDWSDTAHATWENSTGRTDGVDAVENDHTAVYKTLRGTAAVLVDEINILRQWIVAFKVEVAAAASLADLKTRVAALPNLPDRTLTQAKTAIKAAITAGTVD